MSAISDAMFIPAGESLKSPAKVFDKFIPQRNRVVLSVLSN
jgi:hypothetical protein